MTEKVNAALTLPSVYVTVPFAGIVTCGYSVVGANSAVTLVLSSAASIARSLAEKPVPLVPLLHVENEFGAGGRNAVGS